MNPAEGGQLIDLGAARRLKEELAGVNLANRRVVDQVGQQLSLDPMPTGGGANSTVIDGMVFTCTTWAGPSSVNASSGLTSA